MTATSMYLNLTRRDLETAAEDIAESKDSRILLWDDPPTSDKCIRCGMDRWPSLTVHCVGCRRFLADGDELIAEVY